jgi:hypothetical protein
MTDTLLANRYLTERMEDSAAHVHFAMFLAIAGRVEGAVECLQRVLLMDPGNRSAHEMLAVICFVTGQVELVVGHIETLKTLCDPISYAMIFHFFKRNEHLHDRVGWCDKMLPSPLLALPLA